MKYFIFVLFSLLGRESIAQETDLKRLMTCVNGISGKYHGVDQDYATLVSSRKNDSGLLVLNEKGAKIVTSQRQGAGLNFVFNVPGTNERVKQTWIPQNNELQLGWESSQGSETPNGSVSVKYAEAVNYAANGLLTAAMQKMGTLESDLSNLSEMTRVRYDVDQEGATSKGIPSKIYNVAALQSKELLIRQSLKDLESCKTIENEKIRQAAEMETSRLKKLRVKVRDLKKQARTYSQCVGQSLQSPQSSSSGANSSPGVR